MNDFGIDIAGKTGVYKERCFWKPKASVAERTFVCLSGSGCSPEVGTRRRLEVKWKSDGLVENIDSFSIDYLIEKGEEIRPLPGPPAIEVYAAGQVDASPVKEESPIRVRRKR